MCPDFLTQVPKEQANFLRDRLEDYYLHCNANPDTLLTKFYGLHAISRRGQSKSKKLYFVVMENIFCTPVEVTRRYDLKGSWVGRTANDAARAILKENDVKARGEKFELGPTLKALVIETLRKDSAWLAKHGLMDYSLLVGVHDVVPGDIDRSLIGDPSVVFHKRDYAGMWSLGRDKLFYVGIIDMLTVWSSRKKAERAAKIFTGKDGAGLSCMEPVDYARRFLSFFEHVII